MNHFSALRSKNRTSLVTAEKRWCLFDNIDKSVVCIVLSSVSLYFLQEAVVAAEAVEGVDSEEDEEGEVVVEVEAVVVEVAVIRIVMREEIDPTRHTTLLTAD